MHSIRFTNLPGRYYRDIQTSGQSRPVLKWPWALGNRNLHKNLISFKLNFNRKFDQSGLIADGACAHYVMVFKFQWKPFWLATQRDLQNDWTATQNRVNYDVFAQAPLEKEKLFFQNRILRILVGYCTSL